MDSKRPTPKDRKRVLLADDEQWYVAPIRDALEHEGYAVDKARRGSEVLNKITGKGSRPDLVILDIMMDPGDLTGDHENGTRTGLVVLEEIRQRMGLDASSLPVICLTVLTDRQVRTRIEALGAGFLTKVDTTVRDIVEEVRRAIGPA